jgi:hypothetical protein
MKKLAHLVLFSIFLVPWIGCGGGGTVGPPPPPPAKTVTSVIAACVPTTLQLVASGSEPTSQCTPTVNYSDGTSSFLNSLVSWTAAPSTAGTISAAGLFAPSANIASQTQVTVKATSTENTAKSGTATITVNPPPAVAVSVAPTTASVQAGSATPVQFTATVTNAANTSVTWSVNGGNATFGTITVGGAYTAPADVPAPATFPVTATSVADTTKSASATVTITPPPKPTITSVSPSTFFLPSEAIVGNIQVNGSGFSGGDILHVGFFNPLTLLNGTNPNQILINLAFDTPHYSPGWFPIQDCRADGSGCSNPTTFGLLGNQNTLTRTAAGELFQLDQAQGLPSGQNGFVRKFRSDGVADGSFFVGALYHNLALDEVDGLVFLPTGFGLSAFDVNGTPKGGATNSKKVMAVAANSGIVCVTQPDDGLLTCFLGSQVLTGNPTMTSVVAGNQPWSLAMVNVGAETDAVVYSRESTELRRYKVENVGGTINFTLMGALTLVGLTPASQLTPLVGGWQLVAFGSGPANGTAALLSAADNTLVFVDLAAMTELRRVTLQGVPSRIAADETHGTVVVAFADAPAGLPRFAKVDAATAIVTNLNATSDLLSVGLLVSADGQNIYVAMRDQLQVIPNQ